MGIGEKEGIQKIKENIKIKSMLEKQDKGKNSKSKRSRKKILSWREKIKDFEKKMCAKFASSLSKVKIQLHCK